MIEKQTLDISWGSILKIFLTMIVFYLLYQVMDVLVWFIFALIISILFNPIVDFLKKLKIPRVIGVVAVYFTLFGLIALFVSVITPGLYNEIKRFSLLLPDYMERISPFLQYIGMEGFATIEELIDVLRESSEEVRKGIMNTLAVIFGGISATFFIITMAIFLSLEGNGIEKAIKLLFSGEQKDNILFTWRKCRNQVSSWFLVRILACLFVGVTSFLVFYLFEINYAILFAIIGGLLNFIPFAGPAIAGLIFFVITALDSVTQAFFVLIAFMVIQAIEGSVITPALSKKIMGVSPVLVLIALVVGGSLWGVLGAFLAIPLLGIIFEFFKLFLARKKEQTKQPHE